jgi:hypothetical protein
MNINVEGEYAKSMLPIDIKSSLSLQIFVDNPKNQILNHLRRHGQMGKKNISRYCRLERNIKCIIMNMKQVNLQCSNKCILNIRYVHYTAWLSIPSVKCQYIYFVNIKKQEAQLSLISSNLYPEGEA